MPTATHSEVVFYLTNDAEDRRMAVQFCADRLQTPLDRAEDTIRSTITELCMKVEMPELVIPRVN